MDWQAYLTRLQEPGNDSFKQLVVAILKLLGHEVPLNRLDNENVEDLQEMIVKIYEEDYSFQAKSEIQKVREDFFMFFNSSGEDGTYRLLQAIAYMLYFFALLKNKLFCQ